MARFGRWPTGKDGRIGLPDTTWRGVDACLKGGFRGLNSGSSLAKLLLDRRGRRHKKYLPRLTPTLILTWADAHHARTGDWPRQNTGPVIDAPGETWSGVDCSLWEGCRGLPGGSSIAQLLAARRGVRNQMALPPLTPEQILTWADAHHARTGEWPRQNTGPIIGAPGETWQTVAQVLLVGLRGLPGGSSLARLLQAERGVRNSAAVPRLQRWEILFWADAHYDRTGHWPNTKSGAIPEAPGETWKRVDSALWAGVRGLPGGDSLFRLLDRRCKRRNPALLPPLTTEPVPARTDAHRRRSGVRNSAAVPPLTREQILGWADAHHTHTGRWPIATTGPIAGVPGQTWAAVNAALESGTRGLPKGGSLPRLLAEHRGTRNHMALPPFAPGPATGRLARAARSRKLRGRRGVRSRAH
jgi:hypothetical protein